ncbi:MAG: YtcA family lipoprotein [Planctomycetota bacterium]|nr:YtcA family lipoprotein [Planctomycetota bacterium]
MRIWSSCSRVWTGIPMAVALLLLGGCDPLVNVEGAFFPAWLVSGISGVVGLAVTWSVFRRIGIDQHLLIRPITYICILVLYTTLVWLVFYAN